jgi:hypothetical protein
LIVLALLRLRLPGWFDGFLGVASGSDTHNETGGGYFLALLRGDVRTWWSGFPYSRNIHNIPLFQLGSVAAALVARIVIDRRQHGTSWQAWRLIPLALTSPLCLITSPYQSHYPPIAAALLLAAWASIEAVRPSASPRTSAAAIVLAFLSLVGFAAPGQVVAFLVRLGTRDSLQRTVSFLAEHRVAMEESDVHFAVSPSNYIVWRQAGMHPLITAYTGLAVPAKRSEVGFMALAYPGSGNLMLPQSLEFMSEREYVPVFRPKLPQMATLLGYQLSKSSQTWESEIYARRACPRCLAVFEAAPHTAQR